MATEPLVELAAGLLAELAAEMYVGADGWTARGAGGGAGGGTGQAAHVDAMLPMSVVELEEAKCIESGQERVVDSVATQHGKHAFAGRFCAKLRMST
jgi:hypothetical protein